MSKKVFLRGVLTIVKYAITLALGYLGGSSDLSGLINQLLLGMEILSCEHPKRVYNKYIDDYIWVPCGHCKICKNHKSAKYTALLERERQQHLFSFFVTLTYADDYLPMLSYGDFQQRVVSDDVNGVLVTNRERDNFSIPYYDFFPASEKDNYTKADIDYFTDMINGFGGIPYVSKTDIQLFCKRLNKNIHDKLTHSYKNFRYWIVSEYGSTTFRPHYHGIFFVDNQGLADQFTNFISEAWSIDGKPIGITDCQPVESSACGYVSQYVNKSSDLPYVYENRKIRSFVLCSRNPFIGTLSQCPEDDKEIIDNCSFTKPCRGTSDTGQLINVPLEQSYQNRILPKCPCYSSVSDNVRIELYRFSERCSGGFQDFVNYIFDICTSTHIKTELFTYIRLKLQFTDFSNIVMKHSPMAAFTKSSLNWIRRLFYFCRRVARQACQYGYSISEYTNKIIAYYDGKQAFLLSRMLDWQQSNLTHEDDWLVMYPEYLFSMGSNIKECIELTDNKLAKIQIDDSRSTYIKKTRTHFKNAYLDSLALKDSALYLFNILKKYFYAKECHEIIEAVATQGS